MTRLSVNLNKVATLRNTRTIGIPDIVHAARLALDAGAAGITLHPRPDQRHIRPSDVEAVASLLQEEDYRAELNIEGNPFENLFSFVETFRPEQATFVPDAPDVFTTNQGWKVSEEGGRLREVIKRAHESGTRVSLFMDPVPESIEIVAEIGADCIELYTEPFAAAFAADGEWEDLLETYRETAQQAQHHGLAVNAGHDLNLQNLGPFLTAIPNVAEVSIGHALIADALEFGLAETVRRYNRIIEEAAGSES